MSNNDPADINATNPASRQTKTFKETSSEKLAAMINKYGARRIRPNQNDWYGIDEETRATQAACMITAPDGVIHKVREQHQQLDEGIPPIKYTSTELGEISGTADVDMGEATASTTTPAANTAVDTWILVTPSNIINGARIARNTYGDQQKIALLNFANAKTPGGQLLKGSTSLEASLCMRTTLYLSIGPEKDKEEEQSLYPIRLDELLYSKNCMVFSHLCDDITIDIPKAWPVDIISIAPRMTVPQHSDKPNSYKFDEHRDEMQAQLRLACRAAVKNNVGILVIEGLSHTWQHPAKEFTTLLRQVLTDGHEDWRHAGLNKIVICVPRVGENFTHALALWDQFTDTFLDCPGALVDIDGSILLRMVNKTTFDDQEQDSL